jgi:hypothetical protein
MATIALYIDGNPEQSGFSYRGSIWKKKKDLFVTNIDHKVTGLSLFTSDKFHVN